MMTVENQKTDVPSEQAAGRCHWCGYSLQGLEPIGKCPECGSNYHLQSSQHLTPWPNALQICLRLGWPIIGLGLTVAVMWGLYSGNSHLLFGIPGYAFLIAVPINSYFQIRSMLKKHLPEGKRTRGAISLFRAIGTAMCILVTVAILVPAIVFGVCLVMLAA